MEQPLEERHSVRNGAMTLQCPWYDKLVDYLFGRYWGLTTSDDEVDPRLWRGTGRPMAVRVYPTPRDLLTLLISQRQRLIPTLLLPAMMCALTDSTINASTQISYSDPVTCGRCLRHIMNERRS